MIITTTDKIIILDNLKSLEKTKYSDVDGTKNFSILLTRFDKTFEYITYQNEQQRDDAFEVIREALREIHTEANLKHNIVNT